MHIDKILSELVNAPNSFLSGKRFEEIVGDDEYANTISVMLTANGSAKTPKYRAHKYDLLATDLTELHLTISYYRNKANETEKEIIKETKEIEKLELEILDLKRNKWIAPPLSL